MINRPSDVPPACRAALDAGVAESGALAEALAVDYAALLATLPGIEARAVARMRAAAGEGVVARMKRGGAILAEAGMALAGHPSDTVRGWAAFAAMADPALPLRARLDAIRPFADDGHFGVSEWAWMAARPAFAADIEAALALLLPWAWEGSENLRRFASEATRPRGVWCAHITALRRDPSPARCSMRSGLTGHAMCSSPSATGSMTRRRTTRPGCAPSPRTGAGPTPRPRGSWHAA